ncbi:hypothetical protein Golomagni_06214 [Golovinomyces magnicellulatus]|nr:hypothetical protein Golomagni_06214 [Golovinomyces magnicellulatus]
MKSNWSTAAIAAAAFGVGVAASDSIRNLSFSGIMTGFAPLSSLNLHVPEQAQLFDSAQYAVIGEYSEYNGRDVYVPPGKTLKQMVDKPFHIYDQEFLRILGPNPTLTLIAETETDPLFHEAVVWYPPTDEAFFAQNAGPESAGTGLNKSSILQKISLKEAMSVASGNSSKVKVVHVDAKPTVLNPNGGTNYNGNILVTGEGMGKKAPALYAVNPLPPYNATVLVNNYFGRQFNSLNDVSVNPVNRKIYFTDVTYGYWQDFRPKPLLPNQVYCLDPVTMAVTVVADQLIAPNGITFSPGGNYAYITDTGSLKVRYGSDPTGPATIYRYDVESDGTLSGRKTFAFPSTGVPDGIHCDAEGNVYSGCFDGIHVWNRHGKFLGKIFTNGTAPNFNFMGKGRMVIAAETRLYYATLGASGAPIS